MSECACGCGTPIADLRTDGRPRRYVNGHNARGAHHGNWRGDDISYHAVHEWIWRNFTKTGICEICGCQPERKVRSPTQFAFKHHPARHTRNRADYYEACIPCHRALDKPSYVGERAVSSGRPALAVA